LFDGGEKNLRGLFIVGKLIGVERIYTIEAAKPELALLGVSALCGPKVMAVNTIAFGVDSENTLLHGIKFDEANVCAEPEIS